MMTRETFKAALEDMLGVPRGALSDTDTREDVEGWSSIVDVQILAYITSEFGIEPDVEILEAESVGDLLGVLERRQALVA